jgi:hypothetical protein
VTCNDPGGFTHWGTANIPWRLNTAGQGSGKATALQNAAAAWTNVTSADHNLTYAGTTTTGWATNGTNTVLWASGNGCTGSCLALTALVLQSGQVIVESDITFNSSYTWNTNGSDYDTQAVLTHELGHALGIHHTELTTTPRPTMYAYYFGTDGRTLETDDRSALQCSQTKYPPPVPPTSPPATPSFITVTNESDPCGPSLVEVDWPGSVGATSYTLQRSTSSSFTSPTQVYSGPNTYYTTVGTGYWFRVRACNSAGCSGWRTSSNSSLQELPPACP